MLGRAQVAIRSEARCSFAPGRTTGALGATDLSKMRGLPLRRATLQMMQWDATVVRCSRGDGFTWSEIAAIIPSWTAREGRAIGVTFGTAALCHPNPVSGEVAVQRTRFLVDECLREYL